MAIIANYRTRVRNTMLLTIGASVIPMLLVSGILLFEYHASFDEKVRAHLSELVLKHKQSIDSFLHAKLGDIRVLARTFTFEQLSQEAFLQERLATLQQEYEPVMVDLGVINARATQVAYAGPFKLAKADYSDAEWFQQAMQREYYISDVFRGLRGLPHFIVAVRSSHRGEPWILRATIDFVAFNNLVENIRIGETGFAFILNRKGDVQTKLHGEIRLDKEVFLGFFAGRTRDGEDLHVFRQADEAGTENIFVTAFLKYGDWLLVYRQNAEKPVLQALQSGLGRLVLEHGIVSDPEQASVRLLLQVPGIALVKIEGDDFAHQLVELVAPDQQPHFGINAQ